MSRGVPSAKSSWVLLFLVLVGAVLGRLIGSFAANIPALKWLNYGDSFGITNPLVVDLGVFSLTFAFTIHFTIASILSIVIAFIIYRLL